MRGYQANIVYCIILTDNYKSIDLLPTGSEEREVLGVGSIPVAILPSCHDMNPIALHLHEHEYSWVVKIRSTSEAVLRSQYSPWPSYGLRPMGLGQYDGLGEYCGPHTASSVFLILLVQVTTKSAPNLKILIS